MKVTLIITLVIISVVVGVSHAYERQSKRS